ncbi:MAG: lyase family protein, partial [Bacillota bacterium]|nr:lyase family protein [Bacillota bacterium]
MDLTAKGSRALWGGRFSQATADAAARLNSSIRVDCRLWREDILGSRAHARMLARQGILSEEDATAIEAGLLAIAADIEDGRLLFDETAEDIHMFIESELTRRIGEAGKRLHTARSRNDQVATDVKLWLLARHEDIAQQLAGLVRSLLTIARAHTGTIMPGYTHLQRAQPITLAFHLTAHAHAFLRDLDRLKDAARRGSASPLGAAALAGSGYPQDREMTAAGRGLAKVNPNAQV